MFFWETITKSLSALQGSDWLRLFSRRLVSNPGQESKDLTAEWAKVSQGVGERVRKDLAGVQ